MPAKKNTVKKITTQAKNNVNAKTSGLAIASLILAFFMPLLGLILGIIALALIKKSGEKGRGLAIAGVVISSVTILLVVIMGVIFFSIFKDNVSIGSGGSISIKTKDGSSASIGTNISLPSGFPGDIPIYKPSSIKAAANDKKNTYAATYVANINYSAVDNFYNTQLQNQGWQVDANSTGYSNDKSKLTNYTKGSRSLSVIITGNSQDNQTTVIITVSPTNAVGSE